MTCTHILRSFTSSGTVSTLFPQPGISGTQGYDSKSILVIDWITCVIAMGTTPGSCILSLNDSNDAGGRPTWEADLQVPASESDTAHFVFPSGLPVKGANDATLLGTGVVSLVAGDFSLDINLPSTATAKAWVGFHYAPASSVR
jgi:hypothetical protein